jgi:hypothetical protein
MLGPALTRTRDQSTTLGAPFQRQNLQTREYNSAMPPYHITQPDHWDKPPEPCLCGSNDEKRVAFDKVRLFIVVGSVQQDQICKECWEEFERRRQADV